MSLHMPQSFLIFSFAKTEQDAEQGFFFKKKKYLKGEFS